MKRLLLIPLLILSSNINAGPISAAIAYMMIKATTAVSAALTVGGATSVATDAVNGRLQDPTATEGMITGSITGGVAGIAAATAVEPIALSVASMFLAMPLP